MSRPPAKLAEAAAADPRRLALRRMRTIATLLLAAMTAVFVGSWLVPQDLPGLGYVRAFTEAGMVGACADWFAVVSLFRHPFGIPIPHTAIVPRNQPRIAVAMGRFITNNFLTPAVLAERLAALEAASWISKWLAQPGNARRAAKAATATVLEIIRLAPREQLAQTIGTALGRGLRAMPAGPIAARVLAIAWAQGQTRKLLEAGLKFARKSLLANEDVIRDKVETKSSRWIPRWVDGVIAERVITSIGATLDEMANPRHPWRRQLKRSVENLIVRLRKDPKMQARAEELKARILDDPLFNEQLTALWGEIQKNLPSDLSTYSDEIEAAIERVLLEFGRWLEAEPERRERINRWTRYLLRRAIAPQRAEIGAFVTRVVENWDSTTLVNRMELQVGRDLQYIRINGTLVGGAVGLLIYTVTRLFGVG